MPCPSFKQATFNVFAIDAKGSKSNLLATITATAEELDAIIKEHIDQYRSPLPSMLCDYAGRKAFVHLVMSKVFGFTNYKYTAGYYRCDWDDYNYMRGTIAWNNPFCRVERVI